MQETIEAATKPSIGFINVGGFTDRKVEALYEKVNNIDIDILCIAEIQREQILVPPGYNLTSIRKSSKQEGQYCFIHGIAIIAKKSIKINNIVKSSVGIKISIQTYDLLFIYRPPNDKVDFNLFGLDLLNFSKKCVVVGDININSNHPQNNNLVSFMYSNNLNFELINGPTFFARGSNTNPDRCFTNDLDIKVTVYKLPIFDHALILLNKKSKVKNFYSTFYNIDKYKENKEQINSRFENIAEKIMRKGKIEFKDFEHEFINNLDNVKIKNKEKRRDLRTTEYNNIMSRYQKAEYKSLTKGVNSKKISWDHFKNQRLNENKILFNGKKSKIALRKEEACVLLNEFVPESPEETTYIDCTTLFNIPEISIQELVLAIDNLKSNKSTGFKGIKNEFIKGLKTAGRELLKQGLNYIQRTGNIPSDWHRVKIVPIPKADGSYRPISLIENFRLLYEKILLHRLTEFINISKRQVAFKAKNATHDHVLSINTELKKERNSKLAFLDISKAYNSVDRTILYGILQKNNVPPYYITILKSLIEHTYLELEHEGGIEKKRLSIGIPQGSILSPLLFNAYIDRVAYNKDKSENDKIFLFADDVAIITRTEEELQEEINKFCAHCNILNLKTNTNKSYTINCTKPIKINNEPIKNTYEYKYLGVYIGKKGISITTNLSDLKSKVARRTATVRKIINKMEPTKSKPRLYIRLLCFYIFIRPILDYRAKILISNNDTATRLERIENSSLRSILELHKCINMNKTKALLGIESYSDRTEWLAHNLGSRIQENTETAIHKTIISNQSDHLIKKILRINEKLKTKNRDKEKQNSLLKNAKEYLDKDHIQTKISNFLKSAHENKIWNEIQELNKVAREWALTQYNSKENSGN